MNIEITVAICLYNKENYVEETLQSLLNQTMKDFRILLIDDASTDNTVNVVKSFIERHNLQNTSLIELKENKGLANAQQIAIEAAKTKFMIFFDADDIAKEELLEHLYTRITQDENLIAVSCYAKYIDTRGNHLPGGFFFGNYTKDEFMERAKNGKLILMSIVALFRREYGMKVGGFRLEGFPSGKMRYQDQSVDLDFWSRMSDLYLEDKYMITLPEVLFYYRKDTTSLSGSKVGLFAMQNKIRYIKVNIKRRRKNMEDLSFIDYMDTLSMGQKIKNFFLDNSAFYYRQAGFSYVNKHYLFFIYYMLLSVLLNPNYILVKFKSNFLKSRK